MATYPAPDTLAPQTLSGAATSVSVFGVLRAALAPLASLRLTVVLFALAIGIVMIGTLGQIEMDMWSVMSHYFYRWVAWVPVRIFFPPAWFPDLPAQNMRVLFAFFTVLATPLAALMVYQLLRAKGAAGPLAVLTVVLGLLTAATSVTHGAFFFPGGKAIGLAMVVNLLAAHAVRFTLQARGARLGAGLLVIAAGIVATWFVIVSGHNPAGLQGVPFFQEWTHLWGAVKVAFVASVVATVGATIYFAWRGYFRRVEFWIFVTLLLPLVGLAVWLSWPGNDAYLGNAGMRILWQLIKAEFAALVLLAGCQLLFQRRSGIVLLHGGVLLLMFGQVFVSQYDVEEQMTIAEGQTVNYAQDIRAVELAVIDPDLPADDKQARVVAIPLVRNGKESRFLADKKIQHDALPFDIEIKQYFQNSNIERGSAAADSNPATKGKGLSLRAVEAKPTTGADANSRVDQASAYVAFTDKQTGAELGTYLLSQAVLIGKRRELIELDEQVPVGDKTFGVALRFRRQYKPYSVTLIDVRKDDYLGSSMVKNYSSDVFLVDSARNVDRKPHIWMNNPLRYAGETFYQSSWFVNHAGIENTVLS
ncbi:MAG: cytochrome c biogenesis protein ResB, partial [Planctomycetota bacterium]|nr:cytochrome c biogenesis protein ResB [Planctomycetota bacterium]